VLCQGTKSHVQNSRNLLSGNQSPPMKSIWYKNDDHTPKSVFSRAWQEKL